MKTVFEQFLTVSNSFNYYHIIIHLASISPQIMSKSSRSVQETTPMTPPPNRHSNNLIQSLDAEAPKKKPRYDTYRAVPSMKAEMKSGKSNSKESEVLIRKIIAKSKTGEEYLYGFFIFNGIKLREELDTFGKIAGDLYFLFHSLNVI